MAGRGTGAFEVKSIYIDELRGRVEGHVLAFVDKVVDDVGGVAMVHIDGGTAGDFVANMNKSEFTEDAGVWFQP